ncbi:MAG: MAPEG family protein [Sphingopyxis sp.]|jgi:uncharacterized protein|nr:MAPEG family protein [Sphingopyxis sp.]
MPAITLIFAGVAALVNLWLAIRCGRVRTTEKISHGDGGSVLLQRRMRAHLNFAENTPIVLILVLLLELAGTPPLWLAIAAALYIIARIAHGIGMDAETGSKARMFGTLMTILLQLGLAGLAISSGYAAMQERDLPASIGVAA